MKNLMNGFLIFFVLFSSNVLFAQRSYKKIGANKKGMFFAHLGYNRTAFSSGNFEVEHSNYNYQLANAAFSDIEDGTSIVNFFQSNGVENSNLNAQIGIFFKDKWAITVNAERYTKHLSLPQLVNLSGNFAPNAHAHLNQSPMDTSFFLEKNSLYYAQENGLTKLSLGVAFHDELKRGKKDKFALYFLSGMSAGPVLSNSTYYFNNEINRGVKGLSGFAINANVGLRFIFYKYIYLQTSISTGFINQRNIRLDNSNNGKASVSNLFFSPELSIGFTVFGGKGDGCNTCPQW